MSPDPLPPECVVISRRELEDLERRAPPLGLTWLELAVTIAVASASIAGLALLAFGRIS